MKNTFVIFLILLSVNVNAQKRMYEISKDSANGCLVFNGSIELEDLTNEPSFTWMKQGFEQYQPNPQYNSLLSEQLPRYNLIVFLGTWCDDSHYWIPKLVKLLTTINYPMQQLTLYGVSRSKTTNNGAEAPYHITFVPTIIVMKDNKEAGRITESAIHGLEADLQEIILKK